jgi:hypothetical protein
MDKFNAINEAICYWLGYQFKIGRDKLIHEASLRYPIADTITATDVAIAKIQLEKGHPCFSDRLVDVFLYDKPITEITEENLVSSIAEIYELKLAKKETGTKGGQEHQRVIDDILRLAYFNQTTGKDSYFLICGKYQNFKNYFVGQKDTPQTDTEENILIKERLTTTITTNEWNPRDSLYKDYFDFELSRKPKSYTFNRNEILASDTEDEKKRKQFGLNSFQDRYKIKDGLFTWTDSVTIKTTCIALTPFESITHRTHACSIWKIEAEN